MNVPTPLPLPNVAPERHLRTNMRDSPYNASVQNDLSQLPAKYYAKSGSADSAATMYMNRIVSLLLIPLFMLGHVLPHSHAGTGVVEPEGHSVRPHIHVSGDHHHSHDVSDHAASDHEHDHTGQCEAEHSEAAATDTLSVPTDHDSDAIYLVDGDWTASRTVVASQMDSASLVWTSLASSVDRDGCIACRIGDPPDRYAGLPVYLLTASLRL